MDEGYGGVTNGFFGTGGLDSMARPVRCQERREAILPARWPERQSDTIGFGEFVALMATLTALVALSIDMILPALPAIGSTLGVERANDNQLIISLLFLGFGLGQLFYGPLSDNVGPQARRVRRAGPLLGGCLLALLAQNLPDHARRTGSAGHRRGRTADDDDRAGEGQVRRPRDGAGDVAHHGRVHSRSGRRPDARARRPRLLGLENASSACT